MTTVAEQVLERYTQAIVAKAPDRLAALYAPDAVHEFPFAHSDAATLRGPEQIEATYAASWGGTPAVVRGADTVALHAVDDGETFVAEVDLRLTNSATGADFVASTVLVMRLRDGRIVHMRDYTDNLTIATALGVVPSVAGRF